MINKSVGEPERLQKYLAKYGVASRRKIEQLIKDGEIMVNGKVATLGCKVTDNCKIVICGRPFVSPKKYSDSQLKTRLIAYHKPIGKISSSHDPHHTKTVFDDLPHLRNSKWIGIGRLDINTSGLLLFTNDGELANRLMHPSNNFEREYLVRVLGDVTPQKIKQLLKGVMLDDGLAKFKKISQLKQDESNSANKWFKVVLTEGRNREVRRLWEAVDCKVSRLSRIRFGPYALPRSLAPGEYIEIKQI